MNGSPAVGVYLTNGVFLYRVAGLLADADDGLVELEDCYLLDVVHVPITELSELCMRLVTPAGTDDAAPCGSVDSHARPYRLAPSDGLRGGGHGRADSIRTRSLKRVTPTDDHERKAYRQLLAASTGANSETTEASWTRTPHGREA